MRNVVGQTPRGNDFFPMGENEVLTVEEVRTIANNLLPRDLEGLLESLEYDGYIFFDAPQKSYRFQSALLREWWNKKTPGQL